MPDATAAELLESLDRHFLAGCENLSTDQLREHEESGACPDCASRAREALCLSGSGTVPAPGKRMP